MGRQPADSAQVVGEARAHSKIRVAEIGGAAAEWLQVVAVDDVELQEFGWLHQKDAHWFSEAADIYSPSTPLSGGNRIAGGALARADHLANRLDGLAQRMSLPAVSIRQVGINIGRPIDNVNNAVRRLRSLPFVGGYIPYVPNYPRAVAGRIAYWAELPAGYVRTTGGYVRMPANVARSYGAWGTATSNYFAAHQRAEARMLKIHNLDPVRERPIAFGDSPWHESAVQETRAGAGP